MIENELNIFMLKNLSPFLAVILLLSNGCAGRQPQPVLIVQNGDEKKSCKEIDSELKVIRSGVDEKSVLRWHMILWGNCNLLALSPILHQAPLTVSIFFLCSTLIPTMGGMY